MDTGTTLRGSVRLAFDAAEGLTNIVEGMYRNIAASPLPFGQTPEGNAPGIAGMVHASIRQGIDTTRWSADWVMEQATPWLDQTSVSGPHQEAMISALNGVCGDHLAQTANSLAIPMRLRVPLPRLEHPADTPGRHSIKTSRENERFVEIYPRADALADSDFLPRGRLLIMVHGLCMNDRHWTAQQHNHAEVLAKNNAYTPVYVRYNSGHHISSNGHEFSKQLTGLLNTWPVAVESITFIGFSMGGLLTRSAMQIAQENNHNWLEKVDKAVYIGTPHHGAAVERGGYWLQKGLTYSPYTAPLSALSRIRSSGITDLRYGNIQDKDWQFIDEHEDYTDSRQPIPLADGVEHFAIAATLSKHSGESIGTILGDGLVHPSSAIGSHKKPDFELGFPGKHTKIFYGLGHLAMLHDPRVMKQLEQWLAH